MLPIQEISVKTKNGRSFEIHLEKWRDDYFRCMIAAIDLGSHPVSRVVIGPYGDGTTPHSAFMKLIAILTQNLSKIDHTDTIESVDNPCNAEFIKPTDQARVLARGVHVKVNGK